MDPGSGLEKIRIRDRKKSDPGSGINISGSATLIDFNLVPCAGRREDTDEKGSEEVRTTVSSTIRFRPTVEDNLKAVTCEAQHPALQAGPLTASLNIFVQREFIGLNSIPFGKILPLCSIGNHLLEPVLRIRDIYHGSEFFLSRIQDPRQQKFKYFNPKNGF